MVYLTHRADTLHNLPNERMYLGHFYWNQVYECVRKSKKSITRQFAEFMEGKNMASLKSINKKEAESWADYMKLEKKFNDYLDNIKGKFKFLGKFVYIGTYTNNDEDDLYLVFKEKKGVEWYLGFYAWKYKNDFPNFEEGTYCFAEICITKNLAKSKNIDFSGYPRAEEVSASNLYKLGDYKVILDKKIGDIIKYSSSPEAQKEAIIKFFKYAINKIKNTKEYKVIARG